MLLYIFYTLPFQWLVQHVLQCVSNYKRTCACHFSLHNSFINPLFTFTSTQEIQPSHRSQLGCIVTFVSKKLEKMESSLGDMLIKVVVFILVQALVYLILSNSSNVFNKNMKKSNSFRPARSVSIRRMLALISDFPPEEEPSPSPKGAKTTSLHQSDQ